MERDRSWAASLWCSQNIAQWPSRPKGSRWKLYVTETLLWFNLELISWLAPLLVLQLKDTHELLLQARPCWWSKRLHEMQVRNEEGVGLSNTKHSSLCRWKQCSAECSVSCSGKCFSKEWTYLIKSISLYCNADCLRTLGRWLAAKSVAGLTPAPTPHYGCHGPRAAAVPNACTAELQENVLNIHIQYIVRDLAKKVSKLPNDTMLNFLFECHFLGV